MTDETYTSLMMAATSFRSNIHIFVFKQVQAIVGKRLGLWSEPSAHGQEDATTTVWRSVDELSKGDLWDVRIEFAFLTKAEATQTPVWWPPCRCFDSHMVPAPALSSSSGTMTR